MDDRRLETIMGRLLRTGALLAAAAVLLGGVLYLVDHHADRVNYRTFTVGQSGAHTISGIVKAAARGDSAAIMQVGLLLLILTPVARVVAAVVGFLLERDRLYAVVGLIVLLILIFSLLHAT